MISSSRPAAERARPLPATPARTRGIGRNLPLPHVTGRRPAFAVVHVYLGGPR
ncbi:hypothetical protein [Actinoplanes sp. NPDC049802]|uniref:hypothetical protein n=1 Tax=Actinoplanes sp. NPDC049802 TaxID=3154742 RepID=UPI0033D03432